MLLSTHRRRLWVRAGLALATLAMPMVLGTATARADTPGTGAPAYSVTNVNVGLHPATLAVDPTTRRIYVANQDGGSVSVLDEDSHDTVATIVIGGRPSGVAIDQTNHTVYVSNYSGGSVSVISESTNAVSQTVAVGALPNGLAVDAALQLLVVGDGQSGVRLVRIHQLQDVVMTTIATTGIPYGIALDASSDVAFVAETGGQLAAIDLRTASIRTGSVGAFNVGVAVSPATGSVYVTDYSDGQLEIVNEASLVVIKSTTIGSTASGIALDSDATTAFIGEQGSSGVRAVDLTNTYPPTLIGTGAGSAPDGVAIDPTDNVVFSADGGGSQISIITGDRAPAASLPEAPYSLLLLFTGLLAGASLLRARRGVTTRPDPRS